MDDEVVLKLALGGNASALGLKVTFADSGKLDYSGKPSAGFIVLNLEAEGETESLVCPERHWGTPERWRDWEVTVLNEPEIAPRTALVRVVRPVPR